MCIWTSDKGSGYASAVAVLQSAPSPPPNTSYQLNFYEQVPEGTEATKPKKFSQKF